MRPKIENCKLKHLLHSTSILANTFSPLLSIANYVFVICVSINARCPRPMQANCFRAIFLISMFADDFRWIDIRGFALDNGMNNLIFIHTIHPNAGQQRRNFLWCEIVRNIYHQRIFEWNLTQCELLWTQSTHKRVMLLPHRCPIEHTECKW